MQHKIKHNLKGESKTNRKIKQKEKKFGKIMLGLKKRAMKILTYQWDVTMVQKFANW